MELADSYRYSSLAGQDSIRLIRLQPCDDLTTGVQCSLRNATLTEYRDGIAEHYIAISYVWGNANDRQSITVDGKQLDITASLETALRHFRHHQKMLTVWADGICINQQDVEDRNQQVRLMGDIYATAQHTIIFLGLSSPQWDAVFGHIRLKDIQSKVTSKFQSHLASNKLSSTKFSAGPGLPEYGFFKN